MAAREVAPLPRGRRLSGDASAARAAGSENSGGQRDVRRVASAIMRVDMIGEIGPRSGARGPTGVRILTFGELDGTVLSRLASTGGVARLAHDEGWIRSDRRVAVESLVGACREAHPDGGRLLVLTPFDLHLPECESLYGFADRRLDVAVVSTARIADANPDRLARRVGNIAAHEIGHLDGLRHCAADGCLMRRASDPREVDARSMQPCGRCPRIGGVRRRLLGAAALVMVLALGVAALSAAGYAALGPDLEVPFSCRALDPAGIEGGTGNGPRDVARFHFEGRAMFTMYDKDGRDSILDRSRPVMHEMNELWRRNEPVELAIAGGGSIVQANGVELMRVLPGDLAGREPHEVAREWIEQIVAVFRAGGRTVSVAEPVVLRSPARPAPGAGEEGKEGLPHG